MSADRSTKRQIALAGAAFIVLWTVLQILCPYHLAFKEQADYFLLDRTFVLSFLMKPAFLSELAGGWLTQFYMLVGFGGADFVVCPAVGRNVRLPEKRRRVLTVPGRFGPCFAGRGSLMPFRISCQHDHRRCCVRLGSHGLPVVQRAVAKAS